MISSLQRQMLCESARSFDGVDHDGSDNKELEDVIAKIRAKSPEKFHTTETLGTRVFVNEPRPFKQLSRSRSIGIPNDGFSIHANSDLRRRWADDESDALIK